VSRRPTPPALPPVDADLHVHSEWSWDAPHGAMAATCRQALDLDLKAVTFSEHADYSQLTQGARLDVEGYLESVERCQRQFPGLAIMTGVELGEPHRFPAEAGAVLARGSFDLVLGSVHSVIVGGNVLEVSELDADQLIGPEALVRTYCEEVIGLIEGPVPFEILTHFEYHRRFWPGRWPPYRSQDHREPIEQVLRAAAGRGLVLEFNTTRGGDPDRALCPGPEVVTWWREAGGKAISFGSDAHDPTKVAAGFGLAATLAAQAGFQPSLGRVGIWEGPALPRVADVSQAPDS